MPAVKKSGRKHAHKNPQPKDDSDAVIRMLPNLAVGYPRPVHRSFPRLAGSGFQQLLSIMNNGFDIFQKLIEIRVFSVSCFAHNSEGCGYWLTL